MEVNQTYSANLTSYSNEKQQIQAGKIHVRNLCIVSTQYLKHSQMLQLGYGMDQDAGQKKGDSTSNRWFLGSESLNLDK